MVNTNSYFQGSVCIIRRTQHLSAKQDTGILQNIHGYMIDLRCMTVRLNVDVTCDLLQGQSNETLMEICEEQRFEDIDVVMRGGKLRACPDPWTQLENE